MNRLKKQETTFEQRMAMGVLYKQNWKIAAIARVLGLNRKTVFCVLCDMGMMSDAAGYVARERVADAFGAVTDEA